MKKLIITYIVSAVLAAAIVLLAQSVFGRDSHPKASFELKEAGGEVKPGISQIRRETAKTAGKAGHKRNMQQEVLPAMPGKL